MGAVLKFTAQAERARTRHCAMQPSECASNTAEIVIFPGVRYARATGMARRPRLGFVERDRLVLID